MLSSSLAGLNRLAGGNLGLREGFAVSRFRGFAVSQINIRRLRLSMCLALALKALCGLKMAIFLDTEFHRAFSRSYTELFSFYNSVKILSVPQ